MALMYKDSPHFGVFACCSILGFICLGLTACREKPEEETVVVIKKTEQYQPVIPDELTRNRIQQAPGALLKSQADSPIHWQPWSEDVFEHSKVSSRLVLCVVAMPQQANIYRSLAELSDNPDMVELINENYIPVLIDGSATRELSTLAAKLCMEIKKPISFPVFIWFTHERDPIAWTPVLPSKENGVVSVLRQSHVMIHPTWKEDLIGFNPDQPTGYLYENSAHDNEVRRQGLATDKAKIELSQNESEDLLAGLRNMTTLYDSISHSFDKAGGLFPYGTVDLMACASRRPGVPDYLRKRCGEIVGDFADALLSSAMFDPLEGGVYSSKAGKSWDFPSYIRRCSDQGKVAESFLSAYSVTGDERLLKQSIEVVKFAESTYQLENGLFVMSLGESSNPALWTWTIKELEELLSADELAWWRAIAGLKDFGNIPLEMDPKRELFRKNALMIKRPIDQVAKDFGIPLSEFEERVEASKKKLMPVRDARVRLLQQLPEASLEASVDIAGAYIDLFIATGDDAYRQKAIALMDRVIEVFDRDGELRMFDLSAAPCLNEARAYHYTIVVSRMRELASITGDLTWLDRADKMMQRLDELFAGDLFLLECSSESDLIDLPIEDRVMLFGYSTLGVLADTSLGMSYQGRDSSERITSLTNLLPVKAVENPIAYTDWLKAAMNRNFPVRVVAGEGCSDEMLAALLKMPVNEVFVSKAVADGQVPQGHVKVFFRGDGELVTDQPSVLREAVLLSMPE